MGLIIITGAILWILTPGSASAQCGDIPSSSSCFNCHEIQAVYPVYAKGDWHDIHAAKDCCWNCHGGNTQATDKDLAHVGIQLHPLTDVYTDCFACHPQDYQERAVRFAAILDVTPISQPTPTPHPVTGLIDHPLVLQPPPVNLRTNESPWFSLSAGILILVFFLVLLYLLARLNLKNNTINHHANSS
jgi:hypothetical protein